MNQQLLPASILYCRNQPCDKLPTFRIHGGCLFDDEWEIATGKPAIGTVFLCFIRLEDNERIEVTYIIARTYAGGFCCMRKQINLVLPFILEFHGNFLVYGSIRYQLQCFAANYLVFVDHLCSSVPVFQTLPESLYEEQTEENMHEILQYSDRNVNNNNSYIL